MMKGKKGVSPLIATVLLIAFAVALGAVVMNWGKTQIQENINTGAECNDVQFSWFMRGGKPVLCYSPVALEITVQNGPLIEVDGIKMIVDGSKDIYTAETITADRIGKAEAKKIKAGYDVSKYGEPRVIKLFPKVMKAEKSIICPMEKSLVYENLAKCIE
jgi:flagellin-like protein